jgi:hypothetical protein
MDSLTVPRAKLFSPGPRSLHQQADKQIFVSSVLRPVLIRRRKGSAPESKGGLFLDRILNSLLSASCAVTDFRAVACSVSQKKLFR